MTHVKIQTLTPLHIGNGQKLQGNFEYLYFGSERKVVVIDETKVLNIIGRQFLDSWVNLIDNKGDLLEYLQQRKPGLLPEDAALRVLPMQGAPMTTNKENMLPEIREQIFAGNGKALLPGSSLKGAIRTAWLAKEVLEDSSGFAKNLGNLQREFRGMVQFSDQKIQQKYIGKNPNQDLLRWLRVGDVYFDHTECMLSQGLNQHGTEYKLKSEIKQYLEVIPEGSLGVGQINIGNTQRQAQTTDQQNLKKHFDGYFRNNALDKINLRDIFQAINQHTLHLVNKELQLWQNRSLPDYTSDFLETLKEIQTQIQQLNLNFDPHKPSCIVRVGFGVGYNGITGGWQKEMLDDDDYQKLKTSLRDKKYGEMEFPKSRRMLHEGAPLGFIKLSVIETREVAHLPQQQARLQQARRQKAQDKIEAELQAQQEEAQRKQAEREAKYAHEPKPYEGELTNGTVIEAKIYKIAPMFCMAMYSESLGKLSEQCELEIGKKKKNDPRFQEEQLIKAIYQKSKKGKVTLVFQEYLER